MRWASQAPTCMKENCSNPTWNLEPFEYCSKAPIMCLSAYGIRDVVRGIGQKGVGEASSLFLWLSHHIQGLGEKGLIELIRRAGRTFTDPFSLAPPVEEPKLGSVWSTNGRE